MIIKGHKVSGSSHNKTGSVGNTGAQKYFTEQRHYPGLLKPNNQIKMAQIFDNQYMKPEEYEKLEYGNQQLQNTVATGNADRDQTVINSSQQNQQYTEPTHRNIDTTEYSQQNQNRQTFQKQNPINLPKLIEHHSSNHSIMLPGSNGNGPINGIGPNGIEMTSFFTTTNIIELPLNNTQDQSSPRDERDLIQGILNQDFNILTTNPSNNHTQGLDFSPDNTQYTILKSKLFNPNIKDEGTSMSNKIIGKPQEPGMSPSRGSMIHSQQFNLQANIGYQQISQIPNTQNKQQTMPNYSKNQYGSQIITAKAKQHEMAKQLRHKKDMQQLKFYQTLTNQPNIQNKNLNQSMQTSSVGYTHLNTNTTTQARQSINPNASIRAQVKDRAAYSLQPNSRGDNRGQNGNSPYINIQSQFNHQDPNKTLGTAGSQVNAIVRPSTTSNPYNHFQSTFHRNTANNHKEQVLIDHSKISETQGNDTLSHNNASVGGYQAIGLGGGNVQTQNTNHDKSYTQLLSDNSRENYMLKSNMNSKEDIPLHDNSQQILNKQGRNFSLDNTNVNQQEQSLLLDGNSNKNDGNVSNRKRQMISIEKVEKKRLMSESIENPVQNSIVMSNADAPQHQSMIVDQNYNTTQYQNNQIALQKQNAQRRKNYDTLSCDQQQPIQNLIIKRCEFKNRPANLTNKHQNYSGQRNSLKQMRQLQQNKKLDQDLSYEQLDGNVYQEGLQLYKPESQIVLRQSLKQAKLEKLKSVDHKACQRFLERGNKPVPLNYEEQDVLPNIDINKESMGFRSNSKTKHYSRQIMQFGNHQLLGGIGGTISGLNLDDFDEEINGINLGKLFSVYGPNSVEHKKFHRRSTLGQDRRDSNRGGVKSGRSTSLQKNVNKDLDQTYLQLKDQNNTFSEMDNKSKDDTQSEEPIVIRLMANMFSKKKSVRERMQMLPNISMDKLKRDLQQITMEEKVLSLKMQREQFLRDRQQTCEKLYQKFPKQKGNYEEEYEQLQALVTADQLEKLRENPFYLALKANKDQRERIKLLRRQRKMQEERLQGRQIEEDALKRRAQEKVKSGIFAHTFVDYDDQGPILNTDEQEYKGDIMNRPPKDVFSFMNLNFELPVSYYQAFGDFNLPTDNQKIIIRNFMLHHWPQMRTKRVNFKVAFDVNKQVFNVILLGKNCPLSKCCKMTVNFQFDRDIGGKVICMETLCPFNPLDQFFMGLEVIEELFSENQSPLKQVQSNNLFHYDQQNQKPRVQKALASEVSKSIQKGIYKNQSLREVLLNRQTQGNFNPSKRQKNRKDIVSQLFSDGPDESSQYNVLLDDEDDDEQYRIIVDKTIEEEEDEVYNVWGDIEPVEQYETGAAPICPIQYNADYEEVMGYFRAILLKKELSQRAFDLTVDVLKFNPGDYDAWALRRKIIDALGLPLRQEIDFLTEIGTFLEKNFQIWHHRRCIMELYQQDFEQEKEFMTEIFYSDKKNYHAWSYKLWFIERFQLWDDYEFEFIDEELQDEVTNNSLWSYRYFLIMKTKEYTKDLIQDEINYTLKKLELDLTNEAAWVYLRGLLATTQEEVHQTKDSNAKRWFILDFPNLKEHMHKLMEQSEMNKANRFIYMVLLDFATAECDKETLRTYLVLLQKIDRMRENYYKWRINNLKQ